VVGDGGRGNGEGAGGRVEVKMERENESYADARRRFWEGFVLKCLTKYPRETVVVMAEDVLELWDVRYEEGPNGTVVSRTTTKLCPWCKGIKSETPNWVCPKCAGAGTVPR
jgi:hypothetical protein